MPELHLMDYRWDRKDSLYREPNIHAKAKPNRYVPPTEKGPVVVIDIATGSHGEVQRTFGRRTQVGFILGSGVADGEEVYHLEAEVVKVARGRHHKEGDTLIWMKPVKACTDQERELFEL